MSVSVNPALVAALIVLGLILLPMIVKRRSYDRETSNTRWAIFGVSTILLMFAGFAIFAAYTMLLLAGLSGS